MTDTPAVTPENASVIEAITIPDTASLREALRKLESTGTEVICVCDDAGNWSA